MPDYDFTGPRLFLDHRLEANAEIEASPAQATAVTAAFRAGMATGAFFRSVMVSPSPRPKALD